MRYIIYNDFEYRYLVKIIRYGTIPISIVPLLNFGIFWQWYDMVHVGTVLTIHFSTSEKYYIQDETDKMSLFYLNLSRSEF